MEQIYSLKNTKDVKSICKPIKSTKLKKKTVGAHNWFYRQILFLTPPQTTSLSFLVI